MFAYPKERHRLMQRISVFDGDFGQGLKCNHQ
jgi:hypothetical protein